MKALLGTSKITMLKSTFFTCILAFIMQMGGYAQTLKITDVKSSDVKFNKQATEATLGKTMVLTFYDNIVKVTIPKEKPMFLNKSSDNSYYSVWELDKSANQSANLTVDKTFGVLTSAELIINITPTKSNFPWNAKVSCTFIAKRF